MDNLPITEHEDGELRCRDLDLAARLGYSGPKEIRQLIRRRADVLQEFGILLRSEAKSGKAGRPALEFHLNRKQAIYLTTQSGTAEAAAMTVFIVEVFDKYLMGKLIAVDVDTVPALTADETGRVTATSLDVAEKFGKAHKDVLAAIRETMLPSLSAEISAQWFQPYEEAVKVGFGYRKRTAYHVTRDGFALLVMGFTGKKAMEWKVRYIQAFNAMEQKLRRQAEERLARQLSTTNEKLLMLEEAHKWISPCQIVAVRGFDGCVNCPAP